MTRNKKKNKKPLRSDPAIGKRFLNAIPSIILFILGSGFIWRLIDGRPNLIINVDGSGRPPFSQIFVLENTGNRTAHIEGVFIRNLKLRTDNGALFNFDELSEMGPLLNSVDLDLNQNVKFPFSLDLFRDISFGPNRNQIKGGSFKIDIKYCDFKFERHAVYAYALIDGQWKQMGAFLINHLGI